MYYQYPVYGINHNHDSGYLVALILVLFIILVIINNSK